MHSRPTLEEVAALANVSRATASRAVNGDRWVSPEAREAVDAAVAELGWTANQVARSLALRRADSIAMVVPEPDLRVLTDAFLVGGPCTRSTRRPQQRTCSCRC